MTEDITPHNVDLADILSGVSLPTDKVDIYLNAQGAHQIAELNELIRRAEIKGDDTSDMEATLEKVKQAVADSRRTIELQGISAREREAALDKVVSEHPVEYDLLGRPKQDLVADRELTATMWALHIKQIIMPNGGVLTAPTVEMVKTFRDSIPDHARDAITEAINALAKKTSEGFESMVQDHDFLSQR